MDKTRYSVLRGVNEDCEKLLLKYEDLKTVRFTDFCELWKKMKFSTIYGNKQLQELEVFVPEILFIVKQCFVKSTSFNLKVGSLYMLYSLYYKQPLKTFKKILITYEDWLSIKEFIKEVREFKHYDTLLIIYKLISDYAFFFTAADRFKNDLLPKRNKHYGLFDISLLVDDVELDNDLLDLKEIEEEYTLAKNIACEQTTNEAYKEAINYCSNISDDLAVILKSEDTNETQSEPEPSASTAQDDIGIRRKKLISRSFKGKVSPVKSKTSPTNSVSKK